MTDVTLRVDPLADGIGWAEFCATHAPNAVSLDSTRMASYVVSGVGFLGGGVILRDGLAVKGIDTAATFGAPPRLECSRGQVSRSIPRPGLEPCWG